MQIITNPKIIFITVVLEFFRNKIPGILPTITKIANGTQMLHLIDRRSFHANIAFDGYPKINSTGEIFTLLFPKLNIVVNTRVLANPHNPLTKKADIAAMIHQIIFL